MRFSALQTYLSRSQQPSTHNPQIREGKQRDLLRVVFHYAAKTHFRMPTLTFDNAKRVFSLGTYLGFRVFDFFGALAIKLFFLCFSSLLACAAID